MRMLAAVLCAIFGSMLQLTTGGGIADVYVLLPSTVAYAAASQYARIGPRAVDAMDGARGPQFAEHLTRDNGEDDQDDRDRVLPLAQQLVDRANTEQEELKWLAERFQHLLPPWISAPFKQDIPPDALQAVRRFRLAEATIRIRPQRVGDLVGGTGMPRDAVDVSQWHAHDRRDALA